MVSRFEKFPNTITSLKHFTRLTGLPVEIVGLSNWSDAEIKNCAFRGYVDQDQLFTGGNIFSTSGYGEEFHIPLLTRCVLRWKFTWRKRFYKLWFL